MFLDPFHAREADAIHITAVQASRFAKDVAGDYNPIHDPDAKRFCVPGDLLFGLILAHYGLSQRMSFRFRDMVGEGTRLYLPATSGDQLDIADAAGKVVLQVERAGPTTRDAAVIEGFVRRYVAFSGQNFPHFLQPLMAEKNVMFNPERPLVIYDSMDFELDRLDLQKQDMELAEAKLDVTGKRGDALLSFRLMDGDVPVGHGSKKLVIGGLRPYDETRMQEVVEEFYRRKRRYAEGNLLAASC